MMFFSCFPVCLIEVIICQYNLHKKYGDAGSVGNIVNNSIKDWMEVWSGNSL